MSLDQLIQHYGYVGVVIGSFLQSEPILIIFGISTHRGYLELPWVLVCAFFGSSMSNLLYFYIGRVNGKHLLQHRPSWKAKSTKVLAILDRHEWWFLLGYRFVTGFALVTPFLIGASGFKPSRFIAMNFLGAALWSVVVTALGFIFGQALKSAFGDIHRYEGLVFSLLAALAVIIWAAFLFRSRTEANKA
jgi:membrane protein DedA with SNARE-associated domain